MSEEQKNTTDQKPETQAEYRVLARKYRPQNFDELIGQDALVQTLTNAIKAGRIAHAFMLTGVRGVGKTTTARLIARALNYTGADGQSGPTTGTTDDCETARAIAEDRHPDVIEMDAASRTGVDDIREILDGVRYAPTSARYKIYIIDEVHMLTKNAFNALLKTLEEPPAHVKFIFATTEIRKVPVTVLSRCQRFDLPRVDMSELTQHFLNICEKESVKTDAEAMALIARAADGSVRDGLSLLDQAIALGHNPITSDHVSTMLGLSDRVRIFDLLEATLEGKSAEALEVLKSLHHYGADPLATLNDLLDLVHAMSVMKTLGASADKAKDILTLPHGQDDRIRDCVSRISMPNLDRAWSLLSKGVKDVMSASDTRKALEMTIIRLIYAAELPDPARLMQKLIALEKNAPAQTAGGAPSAGVAASAHVETNHAPQNQPQEQHSSAPTHEGNNTVMQMPMAEQIDTAQRGHLEINEPQMHQTAAAKPAQKQSNISGSTDITSPQNLSQVIALCEDQGEMLLASSIYHYMHLVSFKSGHIECRMQDSAAPNTTQQLASYLSQWTGQRWLISLSAKQGEPTLSEIDHNKKQDLQNRIMSEPAVAKIFELFPQAKLEAIDDKE